MQAQLENQLVQIMLADSASYSENITQSSNLGKLSHSLRYSKARSLVGGVFVLLCQFICMLFGLVHLLGFDLG